MPTRPHPLHTLALALSLFACHAAVRAQAGSTAALIDDQLAMAAPMQVEIVGRHYDNAVGTSDAASQGTIRAELPPRVVLTSNRTREVHDALKRRCLYHWIDYPTAQKEYEIVLARVPAAPESLAKEVVGFVHRLREADLTKVPGIAETLDWAAALMSLGARELSPELVDETLGVVLKYEEDIRQLRGEQTKRMVQEVAARG